MTGTFDAIVSIEMLEAAGEAYWSVYFEQLRARLKPGGIAVLQVITIDEARFAEYRRRPDFIQRHVFPGGMLPTVPIIRSRSPGPGSRSSRSNCSVRAMRSRSTNGAPVSCASRHTAPCGPQRNSGACGITTSPIARSAFSQAHSMSASTASPTMPSRAKCRSRPQAAD